MVRFNAYVRSILRCHHSQILGSYFATGYKCGLHKSFDSVGVHYESTFKFGVPDLVLVISPSFGLEIMHHFFF